MLISRCEYVRLLSRVGPGKEADLHDWDTLVGHHARLGFQGLSNGLGFKDRGLRFGGTCDHVSESSHGNGKPAG